MQEWISVQAEILLNKLPELDKHNTRRRAIATQYNGTLHKDVEIPLQNVNSVHVYHQYVIKHKKINTIEKFLLSKGIQSRRYYPTPLHKTETYKDENSYPNSEYCSSEALAIPVHQYLTDKEVSSIIQAVKRGNMRLAVIGTGYWGSKIVDTIKKMNLQVSLYDLNDNIDVIVPSLIDGVIIATPAQTHMNLAKIFLRKGIDWFS